LATDAQNSASLEVDRVSGAVTRRYTDPFGNTRGTAVTWSSGHGFLNKPVDPFTGLDMVGARQYDATLGRFTSVDAVLAPLDPQQNNGYSYAQNNPVTMLDPAGTDPAPAASCNTLQCRNQSYGGDSLAVLPRQVG
jgi:RHS repeat-associated protein